MPIYAKEIVTAAASDKKTVISLRGDYITYINIRFPPGSLGLLKVQFFYGNLQIFPEESGNYFNGDDEVIAWEEFWEIPGELEPLTIYTKNEDEYYDHAVLIRIVTKYRKELIADLIANAVFKKFKAFVNAVIAALGFATKRE
jgi:hypothetical protein